MDNNTSSQDSKKNQKLLKLKPFHIIIVLLAMVLAMAFSAVIQLKFGNSNTTPDSSASVGESSQQENVEQAEQTEPKIEEETPNTSTPYKMAVISQLTGNLDEEYNRYKLYLAVETKESGLCMGDWTITRKDTGESIDHSSKASWEEGGYDFSSYDGYVCQDPKHLTEGTMVSSYNSDAALYVLEIISHEELKLEDISISAELYSLDTGELTELTLEQNAKLSDITTEQPYLHGSTLFKLDEDYFIKTATYTGGGTNSAYTIFNFLRLTGNNDDYSCFAQVFNASSVNLIDGNTESSSFGEEWEIPKKCKLLVKYDDNEVQFGITGTKIENPYELVKNLAVSVKIGSKNIIIF